MYKRAVELIPLVGLRRLSFFTNCGVVFESVVGNNYGEMTANPTYFTTLLPKIVFKWFLAVGLEENGVHPV